MPIASESTLPPNKNMVSVGLIGAGNRFKNFFLPVLHAFSDSLQIVGAVTKSGKIAPELGIDVPVYQSIDALCQHHSPSLLIIVAKAELNYELCKKAIQRKKCVLIETPVSYGWKKIRELYRLSQKNNVSVAVAEGWPFLPLENFKQRIINTALGAEIFLVENDFRTYDYHAIAQLRRYLPRHLPIKTNRITHTQHKLNNDAFENWKLITSTFKNNAVLLSKHNQKRLSIRSESFKSLRIYTQKMTLVADCIAVGESGKITYQDFSGKVHMASIQTEYNQHNVVEKVFADLVDYGKIVWENPYASYLLSEHQIAIAQHLETLLKYMKGEAQEVLYPIAEHMLDIKILTQEIKTSRLSSLLISNYVL